MGMGVVFKVLCETFWWGGGGGGVWGVWSIMWNILGVGVGGGGSEIKRPAG